MGTESLSEEVTPITVEEVEQLVAGFDHFSEIIEMGDELCARNFRADFLRDEIVSRYSHRELATFVVASSTAFESAAKSFYEMGYAAGIKDRELDGEKTPEEVA